MPARLPPPPREIDLDATDELPVLREPFPEEVSGADGPAPGAAPPELTNRLHDLERMRERHEDRIAQLEASIGDALNRELLLRAELDRERYQARDHAQDTDQHLADAERELVDVRTEFERREAEHLAAQVEIDAQRRALAHARLEVEQRAHALRHLAMDLAELRSRSARLHEAVQTAQGWRAIDRQRIAELEEQRNDLSRQLEALRATRRQGVLPAANPPANPPEAPPLLPAIAAAAPSTVPAAMPEPVRTSGDVALEAELATLRAGEEAAREALAAYGEQQLRISELQAEAERLQQQVTQLGGQLAESHRMATQREALLDAAGSRLAELEAGASRRAARISDAYDVVPTPDIIVTADEARSAAEASDTGPGLRALPPMYAPVPLRVLLRQEGGKEIRYPLGKRTTIGRTPDNDIQIDTNYISRHHAVVLSNAQGCVVEDLNSTNGVLVNGRRVGRQSLRDGDSLLVGNTVFTYQQFE